MSAAVTTSEARAFMASPAQFYGHSWHAMQHMDPTRLRELQLEALRLRFEELRDRIPTLSAMAHEQDVQAIEEPEDIVPLLFQHSVYKSYPVSLLVNNRFGALTNWLDRLTTHDLSGLDVERCDSIDSWLDVIDGETELRVAHSSGTAGSMSFVPRSLPEWDRMYEAFRCGQFQFSDPEGEHDHTGEYFNLVWPYYRHGRSAVTRLPDMCMKHLLGSEDNLHTIRQGRMSSDSMFLAGRLRAATARGEIDQFEINPALARRRDEFEREQRELTESLPRFLEETVEKLRGQRIWLIGTWNVLYNIAKLGLDKGLQNVFAPDSLVTTGGGAKGQVVPDGWADDVRRFAGVERIQHAYSMSEVMGLHKQCERERYHIEPWVIPFVLDPEDGSLLPREGEQTGRAAFFDLSADTYWGGIITGDEISLDHATCACGRTTPHIARRIERYSDKLGDDKITCAASDEAHAAALEFLTDRLA